MFQDQEWLRGIGTVVGTRGARNKKRHIEMRRAMSSHFSPHSESTACLMCYDDLCLTLLAGSLGLQASLSLLSTFTLHVYQSPGAILQDRHPGWCPKSTFLTASLQYVRV